MRKEKEAKRLNKTLNRRPNNTYKNENAITLVALIITIIILIILAAVTIKSLTHDGLADLAIKSTEKYDSAQTYEMEKLNEIDTMVKETLKNIEDGTTTPKPDTPTPPTPINPWDKEGLEEVKVKDEANNDVSIPKPTGSSILNPTDKIDDGIIMEDSNQNQWVWVPVDTATYNSMFVLDTVSLSGSTGVSTAKYSASNIISGINRVKPRATSGYREPDLLTDSGYDNDANAQTAGFANLADMATKMTSEYSTMLESVQKYSGFYIGRYELTANGSKSGAPLTNTNWYNLYKKCTELSVDNTKATTRMIWRMPMGCYL